MLKKSSSSVRVFYPKFNKEEIIQTLSRNLWDVGKELSLLLVVLFGSYARGNYTVASDVDLLVVYEGEQKEEAYAIVKRTLDIPHLELHVYSEREYEGAKDTIKNMIKDGVVILDRGMLHKLT
jgi:predicted nucleotidyltransferase